jgi:hypothetical protein
MNSTNGIEEINTTENIEDIISKIQYVPNHRYKEKVKHPRSFYTKKQKKRKRR